MHTTYSSSIISLRAYSTFNDYSTYTNERCPSTCCSYCCSFLVNSCKLIVPTNPSFLYGLRQSTLIQWPPSRRFILGSSDRYCCRSPIYDVGRCCCCCSESFFVKQERVDKLIRKSCKEKCCVKEKIVDVNKIKGRMARPRPRPRRDLRIYAVGDAEAMLSLLSDDTIEGCMVVREKMKSSPQDRTVVCKQNVVIEKLRDRKQDADSSYRGSEWKNHHLKSGRVQSRVEGHRRNEEREELSKDEDRRSRRRECSSSYCKLSDSGESESDLEVEVKKEKFVGESSSSQKKDSRKSGGVIISEETKQDWKKYRDEKDVKLQSSTRDDRRVGSSIQQDWRKKSEKKLTEESEDIKSRNESVGRQSHLSRAKESNSVISKQQFNYRDSDVKSLGESSSRIQKDNRASHYLKSSNQHEHSTQKSRENFETTSTASVWRRSGQGEASQIVGQSVEETGCDFCKTCGRSMEKSKTQSDFQQHAEQSRMSIDAKSTLHAKSMSENRHTKHEKTSSSLQSSVQEESNEHDQIHVVIGQASAKRKSQDYRETVFTDDSHAQTTLREKQQSEARMHGLVENSRASAEIQSESRRRKEEKSSTSLQTSAKEENRQHDHFYLATGDVDARRNSQHYSEVVDADASYRRSSLRSQQQSETRMKHLEEKTTSSSAAEEVKRWREESGSKVTKDIESSKVSQTAMGDLRVHSSELEINSQSVFDKRVYNVQIYSKAKVKSVEELVEKRKWIDGTIVHSTLQTEVPGPSTAFISEEATISQPSVPLISQTGVQQCSEEGIKSGQLLMTSPLREASSSSVTNDMGRTLEIGSGNTHKHPQAIRLSSYSEVIDSGSKSGEEYSPEDTLVSAARMQESSTLIVGEFVEKMSHEASISETSTKKKLPQLDLEQQDKKQMLKGSTQSDTDKTALQKQGSERPSGISSPNSGKITSEKLDSKCSSPVSLTKGSSDQMWDVKDHFVQEASEMDSSEGATSESVVVVRTGKFLWNMVAGICRLRWGSENQKSPIKRQSSPSGSAGGETWFSGDETDEANGDGMKAEQTSLLQVITSDQSLLGTTTSQKENVVDMGASSSSSALQMSSSSGGAFVDESINLKVPQRMSLPSPSVDLLKPSGKQLRRSLAFEEIDESENNESPISSSEEQRDSPVDERQTDVSASEQIDVELKRRKLQRSKLVLQRFDEWEDAYRREREQRKVDEIFMREALSEAIKAADSWEVPVGAVLVQNGKIIARGYNLVEELRDSTAHAEMLCIREASNILRTWRLSETTLYVTLEPCPMCAGAILQARISTLVWGAPNKLLGADGSWIRLFPEGMEGEERSEVANKPAAPVHPFHPKMNIRRGILQEECANIMQQFFQLKRRKAKLQETPSEEAGQPSCFPKPHHRSKLLHKMHNVFHPSKQSD